MAEQQSAGARFRQALKEEAPLQVMGTINAYAAMMAERVGYRAIYLSGGGVANASYGLPDLGITSMNDVLEDVRRITAATELPLLVDIDTGWGGAFNISRTVKEMIRAGAGAVHLEDQVAQKRCGHRPNKAIVSTEEMCDRLKAAADAKSDPDFILMARSKGVSRRRVLLRHALRPSLFSFITVFGINTGALIGGSLIVESIFRIPGLGSAIVEAILREDFPVVLAIVMIITTAFVLVNVVVDIIYTLIDPRVKR